MRIKVVLAYLFVNYNSVFPTIHAVCVLLTWIIIITIIIICIASSSKYYTHACTLYTHVYMSTKYTLVQYMYNGHISKSRYTLRILLPLSCNLIGQQEVHVTKYMYTVA